MQLLNYKNKSFIVNTKINVDRFVNGNQTTIVFGARDLRRLAELVKEYDFNKN